MKRLLALSIAVTLAGCIRVHMDPGDYGPPHEGIQTRYLEQNGESIVMVWPTVLTSDMEGGDLRLQAYAQGKGRKMATPAKVSLGLTAGGFNPERFDHTADVTFIADGKVIKVPVVHQGQEVISGVCVAEVTFEQFRRLASARKLTGKFGEVTFTVGEPLHGRLRQMVELLK